MTQFVQTAKLVTTAKFVAPERLDTSVFPLLDTSTLPSNIFWNVLGRALTLRRDYESATECAFVSWLASMLPVTMIDAAGNLHVDTRAAPEHRSMFTAHTDTVHNSGGINSVRVDGKFWRADEGAALGADDGSGVAILAYMIETGVPGYYVFFRGEERGGVGSKYLSRNMPELFADIDRAVAFDRAGYYDIITHQSCGRCCSDEFATALGTALSTDTNWMVPCDGGVYTDTAEFVSLIPECTNVSVGYKNQHGDREEQDIEFLWELAKGCVAVQWDTLPTVRDPKVRERKSYGSDYQDWYDSFSSKTERVASSLFSAALSEDELSEDELLMLGAIDDFRKGETLWLRELICEDVWPQDMEHAMRLLPAERISLEDLNEAESMLVGGWSWSHTAQDLFDACSVT